MIQASATLQVKNQGGRNEEVSNPDNFGRRRCRAEFPGASRCQRGPDQRAKDPKQWVMQAGDNANTRYSKLNQITAANVGKLQVAWTFSTGVLRGHEGGPLVVGDVMYVHTPFPNTVYALDLNNEGKILWKYEPRQDPNVIPIMCCDTVNRGVAYADGKIFLHQADTTLVALDAKTGAKGLVGDGRRGRQGPVRHRRAVRVQGQGAGRHFRRRVRRPRLGQRLQHQGRQAGLARLFGRTGHRHPDRPGQDHRARQAGRSRIRRSPPGRAINGRSAAAPHGVGIPTIRN